MVNIAYIMSQFPHKYGSFVSREVHALTCTLGTRLSTFSLKPPLNHGIHEEDRPFLKTTYYPSSWTLVRAVPTLFRSAPARACVRQVFAAYWARPLTGTKAFVTLLLAAAFIPTIRRLHIRHIHAHFATMPALAAYFIKHVSGIPYSMTAHAWDIYTETTMLWEKLQAAEFVVTCTAANVEKLLHLGASPECLFLCYHGLDFDHLPPPSFDRSPDLRILAVGGLVKAKGFADLIKACHLLYQRDVPFHCDIIGDGPLAAELRYLIAHHRLDQMVSLVGFRSRKEVFCAYQWATVLCVPSVIAQNGDRDGLPNVILEAMSQGLPVVASRVSGIPEVVQPHKTGWLVPPGNAPALAATLQEIHQARQEARRLAVAAYELVRSQFDLHKNTVPLLQLFLRLTPQGTAIQNEAGENHALGV